MTVKVDHATLAAPTLTQMEQAFTNLGLKPAYGGPHSNQVTHMSLLGFEDGSYLELISTLEAGQSSPSWGQAISGNAGPCAWALAVNDIQGEAKRIAAAGIKVEGPNAMNRKRPDGQLVRWELAYLGDKAPGATLPFLIQDKTPRTLRVEPSPALAEKGLTGIARVILGVKNLDNGIDLFKRAFGWPDPTRSEDRLFGAFLAHFADTPVVLAAPAGSNWLAERLQRFGDSPCAFLLKTPNLKAATATFGLTKETSWLGHHLSWFDPAKVNGARLGCIE